MDETQFIQYQIVERHRQGSPTDCGRQQVKSSEQVWVTLSIVSIIFLLCNPVTRHSYNEKVLSHFKLISEAKNGGEDTSCQTSV